MEATFNHLRGVLLLYKTFTALLISLSVFGPSVVESNDYLHRLEALSVENKLYEENTWISLLHYREMRFYEGYRSQADNPQFFFSSRGAVDPMAELIETLRAMFRPESLADQHPQCIYPARFAWLQKELEIDSSRLPDPKCESLENWRKELNTDQVTVVFPAAYQNDPASMFGHLFLRFDASTGIESNPLMAYSINFAADTSAREGTADYIYKGLFGGFPGINPVKRFHEIYKTYSDIENRDIWEYKLNLSIEELDFLILHVWELKNNVFDYYFLDENCAYRLIALLDVARPDLCLARDFTIYTIPTDVIRALKKNGLVQSTSYRPSAIKTFYHHAKRLNKIESQIVVDIVRNQLPLGDPRIQMLPPERKSLVLALSSEYISLLINKDVLDRARRHERTLQIFAERISHKYSPEFDEIEAPATSPDNGHEVHRVSMGLGQDERTMLFSLAYRDVYHSFLDPLSGFEKGAQAEFINFEIQGNEHGNAWVEDLEIMNVASLIPVNTFFKPASWRLSMGAERRHLEDNRELVSFLEGNFGVTMEARSHLISGLAHLEMDIAEGLEDDYGLGSGLRFDLAYQGHRCSYDVGLLFMRYFLGDSDWWTKLWGEIAFPLGKKHAFYSKIEYFPNSEGDPYEIICGLHRYF
jgi:hypothetical protein